MPADIELHSQAGHCDDSRSRVMGSDRRFIPGSCDRNTLNSSLLRVLAASVCMTHGIHTVLYGCDRNGMCVSAQMRQYAHMEAAKAAVCSLQRRLYV